MTRILIIIAVMSATLMQVLDTTIVNVALPHMQGSLGASPDQISWTLTCYLVSSAIFMPLTGYFTDRLGRKKYLLWCIAGFTIASMLCGMAESLTQIVMFRLLQGMFGAGLVPLSQAVMTDAYPPDEMGKAMAIWGVGVMVGPILGPTLGGYLTDIASWRWTFYINVPVGILAFLLAWQVVPDTVKKARNLDWLGLALISIAIGATQFFLDRGNQDDWFNSGAIKTALVLAIISLITFIIYNLYRGGHTVFNVTVFKDRNFTIATLLLAAMGLGLYGTMVIQPLLLENLLNYPVLTTGLAMAPRGISSMLAMALVGKIIKRHDPRVLVVIGLMISAFGAYMGTYYSLDVDMWWIIWPTLVQGFGMGMVFVPLATMAFTTLPQAVRAEASGLYNLFRTIGSSIGIAVTLTIFTRHTQIAWNWLGGFIQPYNPAMQQYLHIPNSAVLLGAELARQAQMISFVSVYSFIAWSFVLMIPFVFLLRYKSP